MGGGGRGEGGGGSLFEMESFNPSMNYAFYCFQHDFCKAIWLSLGTPYSQRI